VLRSPTAGVKSKLGARGRAGASPSVITHAETASSSRCGRRDFGGDGGAMNAVARLEDCSPDASSHGLQERSRHSRARAASALRKDYLSRWQGRLLDCVTHALPRDPTCGAPKLACAAWIALSWREYQPSADTGTGAPKSTSGERRTLRASTSPQDQLIEWRRRPPRELLDSCRICCRVILWRGGRGRLAARMGRPPHILRIDFPQQGGRDVAPSPYSATTCVPVARARDRQRTVHTPGMQASWLDGSA
jgi:hypothetical protein